MPIVRELPADKLARFTDRRSPDECWPWLGHVATNGYGRVGVDGKRMPAHRLALVLSGVAIADGLDACHTCDNRLCVNPAHLYAGTRAQNMSDCTERRRHNKPRGEAHWCAKLSSVQVAELRTLRSAGVGVVALAEKYGINHGTVSRIARGVWRAEVAS